MKKYLPARTHRSRRQRSLPLMLAIAAPLACLGMFLAAWLVYNFPPIHQRLAPQVDIWRARVKYALNPPEEAIFVPQTQVAPIVQATLEALTPSPTPTPTPSITSTQPGATHTSQPTLTPTITLTPLPASVRLEGTKYEDQHNRWNYCGPANLSMALTFWGWEGNRDVVGKAIKPSDKDKNVMPYEMQEFVQTQTDGLGALVRSGGEILLIKRMVSAGFPVLTEKGYYEYDYQGKLGWMGHYQFITGYDDVKKMLIVQDTYNNGPNYEISYTDFMPGWRSFNYTFLIAYPLEREGEVLALLGEWADADWASRHALELAQEDAQALSGIDRFFAWFNIGTNHVDLQEYFDAAQAYDQAFALYAALEADDETRPYRMMWYQTGPYKAYYYTGRFLDVINLADTTLYDTISEPVLEESLYWRGMAELALGDTQAGVKDFRDSLKWHPGFAPSLFQLEQLGIEP